MKRVGVLIAGAVLFLGCRQATPPPVAEPAEEPLPANGLMFQPPQGWQKSRRGDVLFFDAPDLKPDQACRIAVGTPSQVGVGFRQWFSLAQKPDDVVEEGAVVPGKGRGGTETLRQARVLDRGHGVRTHQMYHGIRDGEKFALLLFTARGDGVYEAHLPSFDALAASWTPRGRFPEAEVPPGK